MPTLKYLTLVRCERLVGFCVSKPSRQGRREGATWMYLCVFEIQNPTSSGLRNPLLTNHTQAPQQLLLLLLPVLSYAGEYAVHAIAVHPPRPAHRSSHKPRSGF